jgi:hypothetical protein
MSNKIVLTETQLKKVVNVIKEQSFDDMISKYQDSRKQEVGMSKDDASMLINMATNWCEGKENVPDCNEVQTLKSKFNL